MKRFLLLGAILTAGLALGAQSRRKSPSLTTATVALLDSLLCPDTTYAYRAAVKDTVDFGAVTQVVGVNKTKLTMPGAVWTIAPTNVGKISATGEYVATVPGWPIIAMGRAGGISTIFCLHVYPFGTKVP